MIPGAPPIESAAELLGRAAGLDQIAATLATINPAADVQRAARLLTPLPADPAALTRSSDELRAAAAGITAATDRAGDAAAGTAPDWRGHGATSADAALRRSARQGDDAAELAGRAAAVLEQYAGHVQSIEARWRDLHHELLDRAATLLATGPLAPDLAGRAAEAIHEAATLMRRLHDVDQTAAAELRTLLGAADPAPGPAAAGAVAVTPDQGDRLPWWDPPAPGHSGIQVAPFGFMTVTLNDDDTNDLLGGLVVGAGALGVGAAVTSPIPPVAIALGALAGAATIGAGLITMNRTDAGSKVILAGGRVVAITGRQP